MSLGESRLGCGLGKVLGTQFPGEARRWRETSGRDGPSVEARGLRDVLIAVVDGLKGFPEAIESVYPQATVQTCIVHMIRHSLAHASWEERKSLAAALDAFEAGPWGRRYPGIARSWRSA